MLEYPRRRSPARPNFLLSLAPVPRAADATPRRIVFCRWPTPFQSDVIGCRLAVDSFCGAELSGATSTLHRPNAIDVNADKRRTPGRGFVTSQDERYRRRPTLPGRLAVALPGVSPRTLGNRHTSPSSNRR